MSPAEQACINPFNVPVCRVYCPGGLLGQTTSHRPSPVQVCFSDVTHNAALQAGVDVEADKLPFRDMRNGEGRLFAANAADVPAVQPAVVPLEFPMDLGNLTYPLAFTKVCPTPPYGWSA